MVTFIIRHTISKQHIYIVNIFIVLYAICTVSHFGEHKRLHLESSKQNYYIISLRAIIKAIFTSQHMYGIWSPWHVLSKKSQTTTCYVKLFGMLFVKDLLFLHECHRSVNIIDLSWPPAPDSDPHVLLLVCLQPAPKRDFMTRERRMFSSPTPNQPHLSPAATMSDNMLSALTSPLPCACTLHCNPSSNCRFWVLDQFYSNCVSIVSLLLNHVSPIFESVWLFNLFLFCLCFLMRMNFSRFKSLFAICSLSSQQFHYYLYLSQFQKYWTILILVLCLLCVTPLVCSSYSNCAPSSPFFSSWWRKDCELFTHTLVLQCSPSTSSRQPQTTHVFADNRIALLRHALRICVAHEPPESCPSFLLIHWAFRACYINRLPLLHHASLQN